MDKVLKLSMTDTIEIAKVAKKFDINFHALGAIILSNIKHPHPELYILNLDTFFPKYSTFIRQQLSSLVAFCQERYQSFDTVKSIFLTSSRLVIIYEDYCL